MKQLILLSITFACSAFTQVTPTLRESKTFIPSYNKAAELQEILDRYSKLGVPGIALAVQHGAQRWQGSAGFANIEGNVQLRPEHLMYAQSLAKTYTAVGTMKLVEEGEIKLDSSIRHYLPQRIWQRIEHSEAISVRMLLNHTSGLYDYAYDYKYAAYLLNNGDRVFPKDVILDYILKGKPTFYPGSKYSYCNSGYFLLAYIAEYVTGKTHAELIREKILVPLNLRETFYREEIKDAQQKLLVDSYLDRFSAGQLENVSRQQLNNILSMMGDDSIVATPEDYILFLTALAKGELLSEESFREMIQWVKNSEGKPAFGLGLGYSFEEGVEGYGHGGSGIGAGCSLFHFPEKDVTVFIGVNVSTLIPSNATDEIGKMKQEIYKVLLAN